MDRYGNKVAAQQIAMIKVHCPLAALRVIDRAVQVCLQRYLSLSSYVASGKVAEMTVSCTCQMYIMCLAVPAFHMKSLQISFALQCVCQILISILISIE